MKPMTHRERVLTAFSHRTPDRVPKCAGFTPPVLDTFRQQTGADDPADYFDYDVRDVGHNPPKDGRAELFKEYYPRELFDQGLSIDPEWGYGMLHGDFHHFYRYAFPLPHIKSPADLRGYPFPDFSLPERWVGVKEEVDRLHQEGYAVAGSPVGGLDTIFEPAWLLRGETQILVDFYENPALVDALLDKTTEITIDGSVRLAETGVDIMITAMCIGTQRGLLMSPQTWRHLLKPRLAALIKAVRAVRPDILIFFHSDGKVDAMIEDLIEIGVDILHPVQPECMDPEQIKRDFGDALSFWGTVGTQSVLPFGTPAEVKEYVKRRIEVVGAGGGLLIAPSQALEPEVPWENILAFFAAVEEYGKY